jgi:hypothetical protein
MDSFELNKILGAILATCIVLLSVDLIANAIFAPVQPAKPGFQIAVKEQPPANATASKTETVLRSGHDLPRRMPIAARLKPRSA